MFDFNSDESNILIAANIGSASLGLTFDRQNDIISPQTSLDALPSTELNETQILRGSKDFDFLVGKDANDTLYGLAGDDFLSGGEGDDIINGGTDKDWLVGAKGNDVLIDGDGGDLMTGGEGADQFWINNWNIPETATTIFDFNIAEDTIKIGRLGVTFDSLTFEEDSWSTTIYDNDKPLVKLIGIDKESLTPERFVFGDAALANELQTNLEQIISTSETPGVTQAIVTPDGFTWEGAAGFSNKDAQTPMQPSDIFSIASTTKAFTAATVLKVVESGKISLDNTLGQYLPEIAKNIPNGEEITIRQLINGSSGIPSFNFTEEYLADLEAGTFADKSLEEIVAYIYEQPLFSGLQSTPTWSYTNTSDIIASLIVEEATGKAFGDLVTENVIEPLGLDNTTYGITEIPENLARSYTDIFDASGNLGFDGNVEDITEFDLKNISNFGASGAVFSNAEDVARFTQSLFGGELLTQNSLNELTNFVDTGLPDGSRYGLGVLEAPDIEIFPWGREWLLIGDAFGYGSRTLYLPDDGGSINTVLANRQNRSALGVETPAASILVSSLEVLIDDFSIEELAMK